MTGSCILVFGLRASARAEGPASETGCLLAAKVASSSGAGPDVVQRSGDTLGSPGPSAPALAWAPEAEARLMNIPAFVRPMARTSIEQFARERGCQLVDEALLDAARQHFGM